MNKLYFIGNRRIFYIYLHQSPSLYPKKILPYTLKLCANVRFHFILYSAQLLNGWKFNQKVVTKIIHAAPRNVRNRNSKYSIDPFLLFVGRDVAWKGLDVAIDFTAQLNEYLPDLKLVVVGGDKNQLSKMIILKVTRTQFSGIQAEVDLMIKSTFPQNHSEFAAKKR